MGVVANSEIPMKNADSGATRFVFRHKIVRDTVVHTLFLPFETSRLQPSPLNLFRFDVANDTPTSQAEVP